MDSSGIGLLMGRYRALGMRKDCIQAVGVNGHIGHLPNTSGLHRYISGQKAGREINEDTNEVSANEMLLILKVIRLMKGHKSYGNSFYAVESDSGGDRESEDCCFGGSDKLLYMDAEGRRGRIEGCTCLQGTGALCRYY